MPAQMIEICCITDSDFQVNRVRMDPLELIFNYLILSSEPQESTSPAQEFYVNKDWFN